MLSARNQDTPEIQSFIIKLWLEGPLDESSEERWRGRITHVPSGTRRYLRSLDDVLIFIRSHLDSMRSVRETSRQETSGWGWLRRRLWRRLLKRAN